MLAAGGLWIWSPWKTSGDENAPTERAEAAASSAADAPLPAAAIREESREASRADDSIFAPTRLFGEPPDAPAEDGEVPSANEVRPAGPSNPSTPPSLDVAGGSGGFWSEVERSLRQGRAIEAGAVRTWLEAEGDAAGSMDERARARIAELRAVAAALSKVTAPPAGLTPEEVDALDAIFAQPGTVAAPALKRFIEEGYEARQDAIFATVDAYLSSHRSANAVNALFNLYGMKTGPKTRTWLQARVPEVLSGQ
jgi:hypothetical protein